jgi:rSAM/selenodomain-associated transferase 2
VAPLVSLIVPVRADQAAAAQLVAGIPADPRLEVILADGGGNPDLAAIAAGRRDVTVVTAPPGRAVQMNAGAARATGAWLLFLHADSTLPGGWLEVFEHAVPGAAGGWFRFALDDSSWQARMIERGVRWRVRLLRLPYGDQGLFVARGVFLSMGGFAPIPLMEDVELVRRLAAYGRTVELPLALTTSARRWRRDGWFRRSARNLALVTLYFAGVAPSTLARWYAADPRG